MKTLQSIYPFSLLSRQDHPVILNLLQEGEEENTDADDSQEDEVEDSKPSESQNGDSDAAEDEDGTPAGKKFAEMRKGRKAAEEAAQRDRDARLVAEARASAFEEAMAKIRPNGAQEKAAEEVQVHPDDEVAVAKVLQKHGLNLQSLKALQELPQKTQQMQFENNFERAVGNLSTKYKDSVPFDREKAIAYVKQKQLLGSLNAPIEQVLEFAHKEMNEEALADWRVQQRTKVKKETPQISSKGTGKKEVRDDKPTDYDGWRRKARELAS